MSNENGIMFDSCRKNIIPNAMPMTPRSIFNGLGLLCGVACVLNIYLFVLRFYLNFSNMSHKSAQDL